MSNVIAIMCESQIWCADCAEYTADEVADGFVTPITDFDVMIGEGPAEWLDGACCAGCGREF